MFPNEDEDDRPDADDDEPHMSTAKPTSDANEDEPNMSTFDARSDGDKNEDEPNMSAAGDDADAP